MKADTTLHQRSFAHNASQASPTSCENKSRRIVPHQALPAHIAVSPAPFLPSNLSDTILTPTRSQNALHSKSDKNLSRRSPRAKRRQPGNPARDVRPAGPERRRQIHADENPGDAARTRFRQRPSGFSRSDRRQKRHAPFARLSPARIRRLSENVGARPAQSFGD